MSCKNNYFPASTPLESNSYAKKFFSKEPLSKPIRDLSPDQIDKSRVINFLSDDLSELKLDTLLTSFCLNDIEKKDTSFYALCYALAGAIIDLVKYEEDKVKDHIRQDYLFALANPNIVYSLTLEPNDLILISQQENRCPLTGKLLTLENGNLATYIIVKIFPDELPPYKEIQFSKIKLKPKDTNAIDNKIALFNEEAKRYINNPTIEIYKRLVDAKEQYQRKTELEESINQENITKKIILVLDYLMSNKFQDRVKLDYTPKNINEKINIHEYSLLNDLVSGRVTSCYWFLNDYFAKNEARYTNKSTEFGMFIKKKSDELIENKVPKDKIFDLLVNMLNNSLPKEKQSLYACETIISYFVQHCEALGGEISDEVS